ncbi:unnamed protein product, partial [Darwinula stevensoni]
ISTDETIASVRQVDTQLRLALPQKPQVLEEAVQVAVRRDLRYMSLEDVRQRKVEADSPYLLDLKNFLWNVLRNKTSDVIEIIFTEEDFSPEEGTFVLKVGRGIKYEFPVGNDETVLYKFDGPVSENTSVYVENDDAWIHLTTSRATRPFKIFYFVIDASLLTQEFHVTGLNGTIEYREEDPVIQMPKRYVWHLSGPPGTGWDFQLQYLILNGGQNEFLYIGGGREVLSGRSGMILSNKEMQNKRSIRVATNDAVVYMVIPVRTTEWTGGFSLLFTRYGSLSLSLTCVTR